MVDPVDTLNRKLMTIPEFKNKINEKSDEVNVVTDDSSYLNNNNQNSLPINGKISSRNILKSFYELFLLLLLISLLILFLFGII